MAYIPQQQNQLNQNHVFLQQPINPIPLQQVPIQQLTVQQKQQQSQSWDIRDSRHLFDYTHGKTKIDWNSVSKKFGGKHSPADCKEWYVFILTLAEQQRSPPRRKRRRREDIIRTFVCNYPNCNKAYGSEGALKHHYKLKHPDDEYVPPQVPFCKTPIHQWTAVPPPTQQQQQQQPETVPQQVVNRQQSKAISVRQSPAKKAKQNVSQQQYSPYYYVGVAPPADATQTVSNTLLQAQNFFNSAANNTPNVGGKRKFEEMESSTLLIDPHQNWTGGLDHSLTSVPPPQENSSSSDDSQSFDSNTPITVNSWLDETVNFGLLDDKECSSH